jgi:hypothetical protein
MLLTEQSGTQNTSHLMLIRRVSLFVLKFITIRSRPNHFFNVHYVFARFSHVENLTKYMFGERSQIH